MCLLTDTCRYSFFFFKQKTAYEMRISDWSSDVCSSDLLLRPADPRLLGPVAGPRFRDPAVLQAGGTRAPGPGASGEGVRAAHHRRRKIGRASCRERVCQTV